MVNLTAHREQLTLNNVVAGGAYVALHTSDPGNNPNGTTEVGAASYDRVSVAAADWTVSGNGPATLENAVLVQFPQATEDWGTITHASVWDGATDTDNAELVYPIAAEDQKAITVDDQAEFPAGNLTFTLD